MSRMPAAVWIVDTKKEHLAVDEARKLQHPGHRHPRHQLRPRRGRLPDPGQRRRDPRRRPADPRGRRRRRRGPDRPLRRARPTPSAEAASAPTSRWPSGSASCSRAGDGRRGRRRGRRRPTPAAEPRAEAAAAEAAAAEAAAAEAPPPRPPPAEAAEPTRRRRGRRAGRGRRRGRPAARPRPPRPTRRRSRRPAPRYAGADRPRRRDTRHYERETTSMANFTAADVKKLRELTGAGMMDCKKALDEADGDFDKAVEILRIKGAARPPSAAPSATATAGLVATAGGALVELNCETDFVAKNERVQSSSPTQIADARRRGQGRPTSRRCSAATLERPDRRRASSRRSPSIGEKIELGRVAVLRRPRSRLPAPHAPPTCRRQVGVLVEYDGDDAEAAADVAMQIAAMRPQYLTRDEVPADVVDKRARDRRGRPPARRASPSRRSPRSSRAGSTASSRTSSCSSSRRSRTTRRRSRQVLDEAGVTRHSGSPASRSAPERDRQRAPARRRRPTTAQDGRARRPARDHDRRRPACRRATVHVDRRHARTARSRRP